MRGRRRQQRLDAAKGVRGGLGGAGALARDAVVELQEELERAIAHDEPLLAGLWPGDTKGEIRGLRLTLLTGGPVSRAVTQHPLP